MDEMELKYGTGHTRLVDTSVPTAPVAAPAPVAVPAPAAAGPSRAAQPELVPLPAEVQYQPEPAYDTGWFNVPAPAPAPLLPEQNYMSAPFAQQQQHQFQQQPQQQFQQQPQQQFQHQQQPQQQFQQQPQPFASSSHVPANDFTGDYIPPPAPPLPLLGQTMFDGMDTSLGMGGFDVMAGWNLPQQQLPMDGVHGTELQATWDDFMRGLGVDGVYDQFAQGYDADQTMYPPQQPPQQQQQQQQQGYQQHDQQQNQYMG